MSTPEASDGPRGGFSTARAVPAIASRRPGGSSPMMVFLGVASAWVRQMA